SEPLSVGSLNGNGCRSEADRVTSLSSDGSSGGFAPRTRPNRFDFGQQMRTELGVGSSLPLCDQASPNSVDRYRVPALSTTTIVEPFVAMQPVSSISLIHVGRPS